MKLKAAQLKTLPPGRHPDGRFGLYFNVKPSGARSWIQRLVIDGKRRAFGLGGYPVVTLAEAREVALDNVRIRHRGGDPIAERDRGRTPTAPTFGEAVESFIALKRSGWKAGSRNESNWRSSLAHAAILNGRPVDAIQTHDVIAVLVPLWHSKHATAKALRQRIGKVMDWARAAGHRADNPADSRIDAALPSANGHRVEHRKALDWQDAPAAFAKIRAVTGSQRGAALGLMFLILTGTRRDEARNARWSEIDLDSATWTIDASRTKSGRPFRVALSRAALDILREARSLGCRGGRIFCGARGGRLTETAFRDTQKRLGIAATTHGWRATFRGWCSDTGVPRDVAEWALNHAFQGDVERSYDRGDRLEARRPAMADWAAHVAG